MGKMISGVMSGEVKPQIRNGFSGVAGMPGGVVPLFMDRMPEFLGYGSESRGAKPTSNTFDGVPYTPPYRQTRRRRAFRAMGLNG